MKYLGLLATTPDGPRYRGRWPYSRCMTVSARSTARDAGKTREWRPPNGAPAIQARAEALPFSGGSFGAAMGVLTVNPQLDPGTWVRGFGGIGWFMSGLPVKGEVVNE